LKTNDYPVRLRALMLCLSVRSPTDPYLSSFHVKLQYRLNLVSTKFELL